ncbi:TraB/GumN family protein [Sphingomicrobium nitratireducens]|uniref:TraB/GumN family protein n=1 Tax=Sphingomicrobium nitratireducens TaxID=2964666 RepID=UPI00223F1561|nr:TraB/GumN family protein [Sphingomicrobium nitratireducens]
MIKTLLASVAFVALSGCATAETGMDVTAAAEAPVVASGPAMWKLADEDTTIYLLGTFHMLPEGLDWQDARIRRAIDEAEELVIEVDLDLDNPAAVAPTLQEMGFTPGQAPLLERVPADKRDRLTTMVAESGLPIQAYNMMESWFAATTLASLQIQKIGFDPKSGVEYKLRSAFVEAGKPIGELESLRKQLGYMDTLSEEAQRAFLADVVTDEEEYRTMMEKMQSAWVAGDVAKIAETFNDDFDSSEELYDALLVRRNADWTDQLEARLAQPGTILVAVGAGHFAGENSVIDMLKAEGLTVTRVH